MLRATAISMAVTLLLMATTGAVAQQSVATSAAASSSPSPEQVSLARARSAMLPRVLGLPIGAVSSVRQWAAADPACDRALRLWVRRLPAFGKPRVYSDGVCEVDILVEPNVLAAKLTELLAFAETDSSGATAGTIATAAEAWPRLWTTGAADPAEPRAPKPTGWEDVSADRIELARQAAAADARWALLEQIARVEMSPGVHVSAFLDAGPQIRAAVREALAKVAQIDVRLDPDQVALAKARIELTDLIALLSHVCEQHNDTSRFRPADFREMVLHASATELHADGLAPPPSDSRRDAIHAIELDAPPWATKSATATGTYTPDPADDFAPVLLREFARLEAIAALEEQVNKLRLAGLVSVGDFLAKHPELKDDVVVLLSGARAMETAWHEDGSVEARVELPLGRLWLILARETKMVGSNWDHRSKPILNDAERP